MQDGDSQFQRSAGDDELDRLLRLADWPEPSLESEQRLTRQWTTLTRRRRLVLWQPVMSLAASVAIMLAAGWLLHRAMSRHTPLKTVARIDEVLMPVHQIEPGRPATNVELAMLNAMRRPRAVSRSQTVAASSGTPVVPIIGAWPMVATTTHAAAPPVQIKPPPLNALALAREIATAKTDDARAVLLGKLVALSPKNAGGVVLNLMAEPTISPLVIDSLFHHPRGWSDVLFSALKDPRIEVRLSASNALAKIDGPVITARLIAMADSDINRREAINALVQIHSADAQKFVAAAENSSELGGIVRSAIAQNVTRFPLTGVVQ